MLPGILLDLMRDIGLPSGLGAVGYDEADDCPSWMGRSSSSASSRPAPRPSPRRTWPGSSAGPCGSGTECSGRNIGRWASPAAYSAVVTTEPDADDSEPDWLDWVARRGDDELARCRTLVNELKASPPTEAVDVLRVWNDAQVALSNAASVGSFFAEVHPDKAVRDRAETVAQEVQKLDTDLGSTPSCMPSSPYWRRPASTPLPLACSSERCATSAARAWTATRRLVPACAS